MADDNNGVIGEWAALLTGSVDYVLIVGSPGLTESREARALLTACIPEEVIRRDSEEILVLVNGSSARFWPKAHAKCIKSHKVVKWPSPHQARRSYHHQTRGL